MMRTGIIIGTPLYMSPEQAFGGQVDGRSDLFSLGAILYRMCAGHPSFQGDSTMAVLKAIATETPRPLTEIRADIPPDLAVIINRLLARDPANRPELARGTADLLSTWFN